MDRDIELGVRRERVARKFGGGIEDAKDMEKAAGNRCPSGARWTVPCKRARR